MNSFYEDYEDMMGEVFEINSVSTEDYLEELFWSNPKEVNWNYNGPIGTFEDYKEFVL